MLPAISLTWGRDMAAHSIPHFHNQPGVPLVRVGTKEFMCVGALPPFDHPHIFIDMGADSDAICPYCSTHYVYDEKLHGGCEPAECVFEQGRDAGSLAEPAAAHR
jgi:uncharacterized Zn-finger protein